MDDSTPRGRKQDAPAGDITYRAPTITRLGDLAGLTEKTTGQADGATFLGLDIGTV